MRCILRRVPRSGKPPDRAIGTQTKNHRHNPDERNGLQTPTTRMRRGDIPRMTDRSDRHFQNLKFTEAFEAVMLIRRKCAELHRGPEGHLPHRGRIYGCSDRPSKREKPFATGEGTIYVRLYPPSRTEAMKRHSTERRERPISE